MRDRDKTKEQLIGELTTLRQRFDQKTNSCNEEVERQVAERTSKFQKMYDELKRLDQTKDGFLSSVTHELRTPLTSIRSFAEILVEYPDESRETRKGFYLIIKRESERLSRLIDDVLDLSKIRAGKIEWHLKKLHSASVIQKAIDVVSCLMQKKDLRLVTQIETGLPAFRADEDRIIQVLTNLVGNAIKFPLMEAKSGLRPSCWKARDRKIGGISSGFQSATPESGSYQKTFRRSSMIIVNAKTHLLRCQKEPDWDCRSVRKSSLDIVAISGWKARREREAPFT